MFLARLGSLNALVQTRPQRFWARWLGTELPSADTLGRVATQLEMDGLRAVQRQVYAHLKRGKEAALSICHDLRDAVLALRNQDAM